MDVFTQPSSPAVTPNSYSSKAFQVLQLASLTTAGGAVPKRLITVASFRALPGP